MHACGRSESFYQRTCHQNERKIVQRTHSPKVCAQKDQKSYVREIEQARQDRILVLARPKVLDGFGRFWITLRFILERSAPHKKELEFSSAHEPLLHRRKKQNSRPIVPISC